MRDVATTLGRVTPGALRALRGGSRRVRNIAWPRDLGCAKSRAARQKQSPTWALGRGAGSTVPCLRDGAVLNARTGLLWISIVALRILGNVSWNRTTAASAPDFAIP